MLPWSDRSAPMVTVVVPMSMAQADEWLVSVAGQQTSSTAEGIAQKVALHAATWKLFSRSTWASFTMTPEGDLHLLRAQRFLHAPMVRRSLSGMVSSRLGSAMVTTTARN